MGYELYITRAENTWETKEKPILEFEWKAIAENDSELIYSNNDYYDRTNDEGQIERFHPWIIASHPDKPPLWFIDGAIDSKNPDKLTIKKMVELAEKLNAKVIGEDGEVYDSEGNFTHAE